MDKKPIAAGKSSFDLISQPDFFSNITIHPSAQVLDLACGAGRYSLEMSSLLGEKGLIYAVDLWDEGIESLKNVIREKRISNIQPIQADITSHLPLENKSIDFCLMATILHDLRQEEQERALKELVRVMKPESVLAVIEFKKIDKGPGPPINIRISEQEAEKKIEKYGFLKIYLGGIGEFNYLMNLRKNP